MLELSSNTIKVLGIFGRLSPKLEEYFDSIESEFSTKPEGDQYDIFRHLTLTFIPDATVQDVRSQLDLLQDLKQFLPLRVRPSKAFVKDEESMPGANHIALEFDLSETSEIVDYIKQRAGDNTVATWYIKVVWFVPDEHHDKVIEKLSGLDELEFTDFYLVSNKQDEPNTIYTTKSFERGDAS